jgi:hypothetical protein
MKKQKLDVDQLTVESFETAGPDAVRGTVRANETGDTDCHPVWTCWDTCDPNATCGLSCNGSCLATRGLCCPDS